MLVINFMISGFGSSTALRALVALLNILALIVGFRSSRVRHESSRLALLVVVGVLGIVVLVVLPAGERTSGVGAIAQAVVLFALTLAVLARIISHPEVTQQTILGAIAAYVLIGQFFAWVYLAVESFSGHGVLDPTSAAENTIYYSFVVLTTLGFGDVTPVGAFVQRVTVLEALIGQMFLAILVARLVSMYSREPSGGDDGGPASP